MKTQLQIRLIQHLTLRNKNKGFTLIELLVVVIVIGVLAAVSLPNLINQIGKARETEAKTSLGVMSRGQQAYHYEHSKFYDGSDPNDFIGFSPTGKYYNFTSNPSTDDNKAFHTAYDRNPGRDHARDFAAGVFYDAPNYSQIICVADGVDNDGSNSSVSVNPTTRNCVGGSSIQ